jgi:hypothetical protein
VEFTAPALVNWMSKPKKPPTKLSSEQVTEEIVQMIAGSIAGLPPKERLAAMQEVDKAAKALSARGKKSAKRRKKS